MDKATCRWPECETSDGPLRRGLCRKHYLRAWRLGDLAAPWETWSPRLRGACRWPECGEASRAQRLCRRHYQRAKARGTFDEPWTVPLPPRPVREPKPCRWPECSLVNESRGFCRNHYNQARRADNWDDPWNSWVRPCSVCGVQFTPARWDARRCSQACAYRDAYLANPERKRERNRNRDHQRRATGSGSGAEVVSIASLMVRDGRQCYLCGGHIDTAVAWPDGLSASVDHVVPLSRGGEHSQANCAAVHLVCNLRKSDKLIRST